MKQTKHKRQTKSLLGLIIASLAVGSLAAAQPLSQLELRAPAIHQAEDGTYYLTGTTRINTLDPKFADFQNNDGIRLWKSKDLENWEEAAWVWNLKTDPYKKRPKTYHGYWQSHLRIVPGEPQREWSRGVTAPELHRVKGDYYIVFALNDQAIGLLKSESGKPEGPYKEIDRLLNCFLGGDPTLFEDTDGKVYCLWGAGMIAQMKSDMSGFAEEPWSLFTKMQGFPLDKKLTEQFGEKAPFLYKNKGVYYFVFAAWNRRDGKAHFDTVVCESKSLQGPWSEPKVLIEDGGQAMLFKDSSGTMRSVYYNQAKQQITVK